MSRNYIFPPWEAMDLLQQILIKYFTDEGETEIVSALRKPENLEELDNFSTPDISDNVARRIKENLVGKGKEGAKKSGSNTFSKLVYTMNLNLKKGLITYLSHVQLNAVLKYIGKPYNIDDYPPRPILDPKYDFRQKFKDKVWVLYTWDYDIAPDGTPAPGIRRSILRFHNYYKVTLEAYRVRDNETIVYTGVFQPERFDYLKLRFKSSNSHTQNEEDLSMLFFIGSGAVTLAVGTYRSIDCGALLSGSALIELYQHDLENLQADFHQGFTLPGVDPLITQYLSDKTLNYNKLPDRISSLSTLATWTIKKRKEH